MGNIFVALSSEVQEEHVMMGKNANRPINEGQALLRIPKVAHFEQEVECSFISIPQVDQTYEIIISKPHLSWGAEMGINEYNLSIATTIVQGKNKFKEKNKGLSAHDLCRLALERCRKPLEAIDLITDLLEAYGQDVNHGTETFPLYGNASFVIANAEQAWVLETVQQEWIYRKIEQFEVFSDAYTIEDTFEKHSENLLNLAKKFQVKTEETFNFKTTFGQKIGFLETDFAKIKQESLAKIKGSQTKLTTQTGFDFLKDHFKTKFHPADSSEKDFCLHASSTKKVWQTANSMLVVLRKNTPSTCWMTGTSSPCFSIFKPFFIPGKNIYQGLYSEPTRFFDQSLWWKFEGFVREACIRFGFYQKNFSDEIQRIQSELLSEETLLLALNTAEQREKMDALSQKSLNLHSKKILEWAYLLRKESIPINLKHPFYAKFIENASEEATPMA